MGPWPDEVSGGVTTAYVMDPKGNLVSQTKSGATQYFLTDKLGSVVALANSSGAIAQRFNYDLFGKVMTTSITTDSAFKFAGGDYDTAMKLYKFGERYYDPNNGIWTQRDTIPGNITDPKSMNRYVSVGGNPVDYIDPTGRDYTMLNPLLPLQDAVNNLFKAGGQAALGCTGGALSSNVKSFFLKLTPAGEASSAYGCVMGVAGVGGVTVFGVNTSKW